MRWIFLLLALWPAVAAGTGCSGPDTDSDACSAEPCSNEGATRCRGSVVEYCSQATCGDGYDDPSYQVVVWQESTDCDTYTGAECVDGACVLRERRCPEGARGICENGSARRCKGDRLLAHVESCAAEKGLSCINVVRAGGETDGVCALRDEPCAEEQVWECHGNRMVGCTYGYPQWERACAENEVCSDTAGLPECGLAEACPVDGGTLCSGDTVYGCPKSDIPVALRDCTTTGSICTPIEGRSLCALTTEGPPAPTFVLVGGGTFAMGPSGQTHEVTVNSFEMLDREVTVGAYAACVRAGSCTSAAMYVEYRYSDLDADLPVTGVSDEQAMAFCAFLGARLPFESEWEFAMRDGGRDVPYPWGSARPTCDQAILRAVGEMGIGCGRGEPWPGCSREADRTSAGVCDLAGNVSEFTRADGGVSSTRVRGTNASDTPPADLRWPGSSGGGRYVGFRCVR
jgi:formylglycine-generating enzyme required for sulfatase activity